ncbi:type VI secretion system baseplate subunit TssF [Cronobacter dublinensis]|uniref:type VI secretion system baseplate subunit TssF n=1 Tax=Cronobacter dublinensis TaxID=413497 RepID=UPI000CFB189D|nr:type VI secretion system baseplate subunit TssF [Cronobacter dublinensis]
MSLTETLPRITTTTLNRYQLDIPSCTAPLDVEEFSGREALSELYDYQIIFTSPDTDIQAGQLISKPATLTMGGGLLECLAECRRVHGVVTTFERISCSADQATYLIHLAPFLALLDKPFRTHRFFVNQSVPGVVEQILREHHLHDWEYEFILRQPYPKREQINQYHESDLTFIRRLLAEVGIFYYFTLQPDAKSEVVHFVDAQRGLLTITGLENEYLLRPKRLQDGHTEIYSVDAVTGSGRTGDARYVPFTSFRHQGGMMRRHAPERYYHTRVRRGVTGMHDTWLILGGQSWEAERVLEKETVSLRITGTNGQLPRRALQSTLLDRCEQVTQTRLSVRNLCKPTLPAYPPTEDRFHWRVISHLGTRFLNMMSSADVLRGTLALYNWRDDALNNRRIEAILAVRHHRIQRFEEGFLLRGLDIEVTLDSSGYTGEGDIHLFGEMLNRFFALYADMNQFNQLTLIVQPEGKCIRWKENHSPRLPG